MRASWTFGRLFGIPIGIHSGWLFIFGLVTWSLASGYFPSQHPGWPEAAYWLVGLGTSLLFFVSLLIHELAHAVVAQREGVPVRSIILFLLGGVAQFSREPATAGAEFRVAAAGPLASLALGLGLNWLGSVAGNGAWGTPASYLGRINLLLAGFNLLPGLPLDGGRLLRALLWSVGHDRSRATHVAAQVGFGIASLFIFGGILLAYSGQFTNGLWLLLIGWFLHRVAAQSWQQVALRDRLQGLRVEQIMNQNYVLIQPDVSLDQLMSDQELSGGRRTFLVTDERGVAGMLSLSSIRSVSRRDWPLTRVGAAMTPAARLSWLAPGDDLADVLEEMVNEDLTQAPVVEQGRLVGLVAREDLLCLGQEQST